MPLLDSPNQDPALAKHYRKMASDPYGHLAELQDLEAARTAMKEIPCGADEMVGCERSESES